MSRDDYTQVNERILEFITKYPDGSLQTITKELVELPDSGWWWVVTAHAYRDRDDPRPGVGTAQEAVPGRTSFTRGSEIQNAETSAWGRAMAALGIATHKGIATAQDVRNAQAYAQTKDVHRGGPDPDEDERYYIGPHSAGMVASQKQKAALYAIMSELHIPKEKAADFLHWLLVKLVSPDRPAGYILQKGDASTLIEALKGDRGIALADEFLGVLT